MDYHTKALEMRVAAEDCIVNLELVSLFAEDQIIKGHRNDLPSSIRGLNRALVRAMISADLAKAELLQVLKMPLRTRLVNPRFNSVS